jgi:hypothetical protein
MEIFHYQGDFKRLFLIFAPCLCMACGGTSTQPVTLTPQPMTPEQPTLFEVAGQEIDRRYQESLSLERTDLSLQDLVLRTSYNGSALFEELKISGSTDGLQLRANISLNAIISNNSTSISGALTEFQSNRNGGYVGDVNLTDGSFDLTANSEAEYHFTARLEGELTPNNDSGLEIKGGINGDLFGPDSRRTRGDAILILSGQGGNIQLQGRFISE